ncbi:MAG: hypothetical protein ABFR47_02645 [Verrucomicrobiota bacterium]
MFLEVYAIPLNDYSAEAGVSVRPENKRLIEMTGVRIRHSAKLQDRAEIVMPNKDTLIAVGSYEDLLDRLENAKGLIARV